MTCTVCFSITPTRDIGSDRISNSWLESDFSMTIISKRSFSLIGSVISAFMMISVGSTTANAACGKVSITEMNWASASVVTNVAKFLMEQGYGCKVTAVPSDTVPAATSLAEKGEPDIATEMWVNSAPVYQKLEAEGKVKTVGNVLSDGGAEHWLIPKYLAEKHPELKTIEGVLANPKLVGGRFIIVRKAGDAAS